MVEAVTGAEYLLPDYRSRAETECDQVVNVYIVLHLSGVDVDKRVKLRSPVRQLVIARIVGQVQRIGAIGGHMVDFPIAIPIGLEGDVGAIW